jgi:hypothetical protein
LAGVHTPAFDFYPFTCLPAIASRQAGLYFYDYLSLLTHWQWTFVTIN